MGSEKRTIEEQFQQFHEANPWVLEALEALAYELHDKGHRKIGIKMLYEVVRWQTMRRTVGDEFKLNNNYTSHYVRLIIERNPELADSFELRRLRAA
jgi:hypothetical protein